MSIPDGYGIYATADIAALVEVIEAGIAVQQAWDVIQETRDASDLSAYDWASKLADAAWSAITPELLARVTATTDATPPASGVRAEGSR